jgi:hypothetical protein
MAFVPPTFNLPVRIYSHGDWPGNPPRVSGVLGQWRCTAKMTAQTITIAAPTNYLYLSEILLPKGTDVRGRQDGGANLFDTITIEVAGTELPFTVEDVLDVGKGFTNEYREALVTKVPFWPVPIPS